MVYRYSKPPTQRQLRVGEELKHGLSFMFSRNELSHPFFEQVMITVSEVRVSPDLKLATAFVSAMEQVNENDLVKFLNEISPTIRKIIAKKVNLKFAPEVRFAVDKSFKEGAKIDSIIAKLKH
jgi:ribosome-binding factor A